MFRSNTKMQPQYKMKHRLTGAVIVVALAVIVISVLLKEPKSQISAEMQKTEIPIKTTRQTTSITDGNLVLTVDKKSNLDSNSGLKASKTMTSQQPPDQSSQDISEDNIPLHKNGWSVRVGTYSDIENVDSVSTLLIDNGFQARHTQVQTTLGVATRIWLGPYTKKEAAEKVSLRLKAITGEKGYVTQHSS